MSAQGRRQEDINILVISESQQLAYRMQQVMPTHVAELSEDEVCYAEVDSLANSTKVLVADGAVYSGMIIDLDELEPKEISALHSHCKEKPPTMPLMLFSDEGSTLGFNDLENVFLHDAGDINTPNAPEIEAFGQAVSKYQHTHSPEEKAAHAADTSRILESLSQPKAKEHPDNTIDDVSHLDVVSQLRMVGNGLA